MLVSGEAAVKPGNPADAYVALVRPGDWRTLAVTIAGAVLMDVAGRSRFPGLAGTILMVATAAGLLLSGRLVNRQARLTVLLVPAFGLWLTVRMSPWLIVPDVLVAAGLLTVAASVAYRGDLFDLLLPEVFGRVLHGVLHGLAAPAFAVRPLVVAWDEGRTTRPTNAGAFVRGLVLAFPIVLACGLLLGKGDVVFASFFRINLDMDAFSAHAMLLLVGAWDMGGLLRVASAMPIALPLRPNWWRLGAVEVAVILGALDLLFATFAVAQVVAASGGAAVVLQTAGLTYAEYARTGFFQLLWVAAITLVVLLALHSLAVVTTPVQLVHFQFLAGVTVLLTLVIVYVAVRRLFLYDAMFGLTMLRLYCIVFAGWIAVVFLLLACSFATVAPRRHWFLGSAASTGLAMLLMLNMMNPEALVSSHNLTRADGSRPIDIAYLADLSNDAVPVLVEALPRVSPATRQEILRRLCTNPRHAVRDTSSWLGYNRAATIAAEARTRVC